MAMEQVLNQEYSQLCRHQGKKIVVMGVSFSAQERNIGTWQGELLEEDGSLIRKLAPEDKQQACDLLFAAPLSIEQCSYLETVQGRKLDLLDLDPPHKIVADQRKLAEFFLRLAERPTLQEILAHSRSKKEQHKTQQPAKRHKIYVYCRLIWKQLGHQLFQS